MRICKKLEISDNKFFEFLSQLTQANPDIIIEDNLRKELKENLEAMKSWYSSEKLNAYEGDGKDRATAVVLIKDTVDFTEELIKHLGIKEPVVAIGADSGQNKGDLQK